MILAELRTIKTEKKNLRQFAGLCFLVLVGLGGFKLYHGEFIGFWFCALGLVLGALGWVWPIVFKPFYLVWMGFAVVLGYLVSRVVLFVTFYGMITPLGLVLRYLGKTSVSKKGAESFWVVRKDFSMKPEKYEQQF